MKVNVEFGGGLELITKEKRKATSIEFPDKTSISLRELVCYIRDNCIKDRPDLFSTDNTVRPGILVLINDCDWELTGGIDSTISDNDTVVFISTLHGG